MLWLWVIFALTVMTVLLCQTAIGMHFKSQSGNPPLVSTIVPARNEERNIDRRIRGLPTP
jgi:hypothetical protein